ncbi:2979_t:CDS:2, partial [Racocetra persica]
MPKQSKTNGIRNHNKIPLSVNFPNIDFAIISLIYSNYKTMFELNQVKYDEAKKILTAESG